MSFFRLLGPNGAGKTTTTNILTTLAVADSGRALVAGHDPRAGHRAARRRIGVVAQGSSADPAASGHANLLLQARLYGLSVSEAKRRTATRGHPRNYGSWRMVVTSQSLWSAHR